MEDHLAKNILLLCLLVYHVTYNYMHVHVGYNNLLTIQVEL